MKNLLAIFAFLSLLSSLETHSADLKNLQDRSASRVQSDALEALSRRLDTKDFKLVIYGAK